MQPWQPCNQHVSEFDLLYGFLTLGTCNQRVTMIQLLGVKHSLAWLVPPYDFWHLVSLAFTSFPLLHSSTFLRLHSCHDQYLSNFVLYTKPPAGSSSDLDIGCDLWSIFQKTRFTPPLLRFLYTHPCQYTISHTTTHLLLKDSHKVKYFPAF